MIISFTLTKRQILERTKSETRRLWHEKTGRRFVKGSTHQAWSSLPYAKGAKKIADILATRDAYQEPLGAITTDGAAREGFPEMTGNDFVEFFIEAARKSGKKITRDSLVWVIEFQIIKIYD